MHTLFAAPGWGSTIAEAGFAWAGIPFERVLVDVDQPSPERDRLRAANPLVQLPTVLLPDGTVLTQSAAILLYLDDLVPDAGLVPPPGDPARTRFLRWLAFMVSAIYPTFTYADYPARWVGDDAAAAATLKKKILAYRQTLWRQVEAELEPSPWFLGTRFSALDLYVGAMTRWRPGEAWFAEHCPRLTSVADAVRAEPRLAKIWAQNAE